MYPSRLSPCLLYGKIKNKKAFKSLSSAWLFSMLCSKQEQKLRRAGSAEQCTTRPHVVSNDVIVRSTVMIGSSPLQIDRTTAQTALVFYDYIRRISRLLFPRTFLDHIDYYTVLGKDPLALSYVPRGSSHTFSVLYILWALLERKKRTDESMKLSSTNYLFIFSLTYREISYYISQANLPW
jgi:hypothetical protein